MTVSNRNDADDIDPQGDQGQDFDLRIYLDTVLSWWKEILLLACLAAAAAAVGVLLQERVSPTKYEAVSDIVTVRLVSQVALDERMVIAGDTTSDANSVMRRREAMNKLVKSGVVAEAVVAELGNLLTEAERNPNALLEMVEVESPSTPDGRTPSDIIRIHVVAGDPDKAAAIANSWAKHFIELVNSVFGQVPPEISESVSAELVDAATAHQLAQEALEANIAESRIDRLQQQIDQLVAQRTALQVGRSQILTAIADQDRSARIRFFTDLTDAQTQAHYRVLRNQSQSALDGLTQLFLDRDLTLRYLDLARSLQEQITVGGESAVATNQQTLQLLKNQIYSLPETFVNADGSTTVPTNITFITDSSASLPSAADQQADAQALVTALEQRAEQLDARIEEASQAILAGDDYKFLDQISAESLATSAPITSTHALSATVQPADTLAAAIQRSYTDLFDIGEMVQLSQLDVPAEDTLASTLDQLDRTIQELRAEYAAEDAELQLLVQSRNLAWEAYTALSRKAIELGIEQSAATTEVRMGSAAIPPSKPVAGPSLIVTSALAFAIGLLLAIFLALIASYMGYKPFLSGRHA